MRQDKTITLDNIPRLVDGLWITYSKVDSDKEREDIADMLEFILDVFLGTLKEEEVVKMVLGERGSTLHLLSTIQSTST